AWPCGRFRATSAFSAGIQTAPAGPRAPSSGAPPALRRRHVQERAPSAAPIDNGKEPPVTHSGTAPSAEPSGGVAGTAARPTPMVKFEKVRKAYGDLVVLDDLDFEVAENEKIAIIGPSGSGKTTILRVLMTLVKPDAGRV